MYYRIEDTMTKRLIGGYDIKDYHKVECDVHTRNTREGFKRYKIWTPYKISSFNGHFNQLINWSQ